MLVIDTEDTGVDFHHGAKPYFVTLYGGEQTTFYEWDVDPLTRDVTVPKSDKREIQDQLKRIHNWGTFDDETRERHVIIGQNIKFDIKALKTIGITDWPWQQTRDTLLAAHLLHSNSKHDLTALSLKYLRVRINEYEDNLERIVKKCRAFCRKHHKDWLIAKHGLPCMPSAKKSAKEKSEKLWKFDCWIPRTLAQVHNLPIPDDDCEHQWGEDEVCSLCEGHHWWTVNRDYANVDGVVTHGIWQVQKKQIEKKGLWSIYKEQLKLLPILYEMEENGVTESGVNHDKLTTEYQEKSLELGEDCVDLADSIGYELKLPKNGINDSLRKVLLDGFKVEPMKGAKSKTDKPSFDKYIMEHYTLTLPRKSKAGVFVRKLLAKRSLDTALTFMASYKKFRVPLEKPFSEEIVVEKDDVFVRNKIVPDWYILYPSLNPTGTATLRMSSTNPNEQQISKKKGFNLRYCFGPPPGWEMWRLDYENLELRIPAYEAGEESMIELFEKPDDPPYFGSYHLMNASIIYPDLFWPLAEIKGAFKEKYEETWYSWCKNFGFAIQYGAMLGSGTADRAAHKKGAQALVGVKLKKLSQLNRKQVEMANRLGYVETIPDKTVDPIHGYPVYCTRTGYGKVLETVPMSYHIQSTAMQCTRKAMIRWDEQLKWWKKEEGFLGRMDVQVHDELGALFPKNKKGNYEKILVLKGLMEKSGDDIGIPLKVSVSYHPNNWSEKEKYDS